MNKLIGKVSVVRYEDNFCTVVLSDGTKLHNDEPFDPTIISDIYEYEDRYQLMLSKRKEDELR